MTVHHATLNWRRFHDVSGLLDLVVGAATMVVFGEHMNFMDTYAFSSHEYITLSNYYVYNH
jgi:hypothetical protein